ncbi:hypothetical protein [Microbacterium sp. R86528]|uniref:hypothetical protein n=1 Tax=Microbacterium sp. R86528 TaxID=3093864 RepID=UPI0037CB4F1C
MTRHISRRAVLTPAFMAAALSLSAASAFPIHPIVVTQPTLIVEAPASTIAGESTVIDIAGATGSLQLIVAGSLGTATFDLDPDGGATSFTLPSGLTQVAGLMTITAVSDGITTSTQVVITPAKASSVQTIVGARSIVADDADVSMAVALPQDVWGNAVANGTPVEFTRINPQDSVQVLPTTSAHLLAWADLFSGTVAGRNTVWASLGEVRSPSADLDEVAGPPRPFALSVVAPSGSRAVADGRSLVLVRTDILRDAFDNVLADGTAVEFRWSGPNGEGTANAVLISGQAETWLQSPTIAGVTMITARAKGVDAATSIDLTFAPALGEFPATVTRSDGVLRIDVGPVIGLDGALAPDGAAVSVSGPGVSAEGQLDSGSVSIQIPLAGSVTIANIDVTILGSTVAVNVP